MKMPLIYTDMCLNQISENPLLNRNKPCHIDVDKYAWNFVTSLFCSRPRTVQYHSVSCTCVSLQCA